MRFRWASNRKGGRIIAADFRPRAFAFAASALRRSAGIAALLGSLASARALAQGLPGSIEIGGGAGRFYGGAFASGSTKITDRKSDADDAILRGFWIAGQITRDWGVEVAVRRTVTDLLESGGGVFPTKPAVAELDIASIEVLAVRSWRRGNFAPYAGFGLGLTNLDPDVDDPAVRDTNRAAVSLSTGARFYVVRWAGLRVDLRARATYLGKRNRGDRGWDDSGRWFVNEEILGGIFFSFGGR